MKHFALLTAAALGLGACTTESFEARPYDIEFPINRNYQAVYAGVLEASRACWGGQFAILSMSRVEGQLYPDLGYGVVYHGETAMMPVHHTSTKIERAGRGSIVRVKFGQPPRAGGDGGATFRGWVEYWAAGGRACPKVGALTAPKA